MADALKKCPDDIGVNGGGHASACGLSLPKEKLADFKKFINDYYRSLRLKNQEDYLRSKSDVVLDSFIGVNEDLFAEVCLLEPFGDGNTEPIFEIEAEVKSVKILKDKHLSIVLRDTKDKDVKMVAFYAPDEWKNVEIGDRVNVQFTLLKNEYRGIASIEGNIISLETKDKLW